METYNVIQKKDNFPKLEECYLLQFDGLAVPNPGEATGGAVLFKNNTKKDILFETGEYIKFGTNNIAEYTGLFIGVKEAVKLKIKNVLIEGDSMLVTQQVAGKWKVNNDVLKIYHSEIVKLLKTQFDFVGIKHVYRKDNAHADDLTNETFRIKSSFIRINEDLI
jgi:ribonuclease HI